MKFTLTHGAIAGITSLLIGCAGYTFFFSPAADFSCRSGHLATDIARSLGLLAIIAVLMLAAFQLGRDVERERSP